MTSILKVSEIQDPTNSNTALTIDANGNVNIPGHVVQVVSATKTDTYTTSSSTPVAVPSLSVSITPKYSTSKVLVRVVFNTGGDTSTSNCDYYIYRDGAVISGAIGDASGSEQRSAAHIDPSATRMQYNETIEYLDSPATTSATTYQLYMRTQGYTFYINRGSYQDGNTGVTISTITAMEIAQ